MTMNPYNTDLTRALKWQQNNAPMMQSIISQKAAWYERYQTGFWSNWQTNVFDIRTANAFGLVVWCIILGIPLDLFNFEPLTNDWAYGALRGNYLDGGGNKLPLVFTAGPSIYSNGVLVPSTGYTVNGTAGTITFGTAPASGAVLKWKGTITQNNTGQPLVINQLRALGTGTGSQVTFSFIPADSANFNEVGNNFYGGGTENVSLLSEVRFACQLRYAALVSNGRQQWINQMLAYIFNNGAAWNFPGKKYFYLTDNTGSVQAVTGANIYSNGVLVPPANYTLNTSTGAVVFTTAPASGAALTWTGSWNWATISTPQAFGTGNGTNKNFTLTNGPGAVNPVTRSNYMEYRIGANMGISSAFLNILNNSQYGIMPVCAGIAYAVVQEN